jgi:hypothetical protein
MLKRPISIKRFVDLAFNYLSSNKWISIMWKNISTFWNSMSQSFPTFWMICMIVSTHQLKLKYNNLLVIYVNLSSLEIYISSTETFYVFQKCLRPFEKPSSTRKIIQFLSKILSFFVKCSKKIFPKICLVIQIPLQSNLWTTTTLGTSKLWPLLTDGPCSGVAYTIQFVIGPSKWWPLWPGGRCSEVIIRSGLTV